MGSTSSIVISFSIAILLLLILLLLLSYNSKCKTDKVERFTNDNSLFNMNGGYNSPLGSLYNEGFENGILENPQKYINKESVAVNDPYAQKSDLTKKTTESPTPMSLNESSKDKKNNNGLSAFDNQQQNYLPLNGEDTETFENYIPGTQDPTTCFKRDRLTKDDLLPKDANLKWAGVNPSSAGDITDKNFLTAGYHMGINTVGQSLRNANLQLRSEIPNPQVAVSPWMISTIEPDIRPVSFEIGSSPAF